MRGGWERNISVGFGRRDVGADGSGGREGGK